jgi:hypothetical protein
MESFLPGIPEAELPEVFHTVGAARAHVNRGVIRAEVHESSPLRGVHGRQEFRAGMKAF